MEGALNRNKAMREQLQSEGTKYDYLVSIEGGYNYKPYNLLWTKPDTVKHYLVDAIIVENDQQVFNMIEYPVIPISGTIYGGASDGMSLNSLIGNMTGIEKNKQSLGVSGHLSNGLLDRTSMMINPIIAAFCPFVFPARYNSLENAIQATRIKKIYVPYARKRLILISTNRGG